jgi:hypothetical protein
MPAALLGEREALAPGGSSIDACQALLAIVIAASFGRIYDMATPLPFIKTGRGNCRNGS